jgi:hypothetical protein
VTIQVELLEINSKLQILSHGFLGIMREARYDRVANEDLIS